jgi:hypothetical protein
VQKVKLQFNEPQKLKPPENPTLIYAVFKERKKGKKFREIFDLYQNNKLPGFNGSASQFQSEDALERYYRKYSPSKTAT